MNRVSFYHRRSGIVRGRFFTVGLLVGLILNGLLKDARAEPNNLAVSNVEFIILGVAQDAGYPQINCYQPHCMPGWQEPNKARLATSLSLVDHATKQKFLFEATPDIKQQLFRLHQIAPDPQYRFEGIFLTHAHMGHYTGLMHLGREAASSERLPVFVMPRMRHYLEKNGPWDQLVKLQNIQLKPLSPEKPQRLNSRIQVTPLLVPHRDEYSETVGFQINGPNKSALFIPDIDKWQKWQVDIKSLIQQVDYAFLDATFFAAGELPNRDIAEVPHPFVTESMQLFADLDERDKKKIFFIHFNHTNPLLIDGSKAQTQVKLQGFNFAVEGMRFSL